jgi:sulfur-oxidizing protein SoxX
LLEPVTNWGQRFLLARPLVVFIVCSSAASAASAESQDTTEPLSSVQASSEIGREAFLQRDQGHCVLCHRIEGLAAPFQGDLGPDLTDVGARLSPAQIRYRIVDASRLNPETVMPPYFRTHGLNQVATLYVGQPILPPETIEHLVRYLSEQVGSSR